jgi:LuxR family transcriptional regulator, maltose regulon positive regulatory protein
VDSRAPWRARRRGGRAPARPHYADLLESALAQRQGDLARSRRILTAALVESPVPDLAIDGVILGRLCLAEHQPDAALDAVQSCLDGSAANLRLVDEVAAHLVSASAQRILGNSTEADEALEHALELATSEGLVQVFLTSGRIVQSMLTVAISPNGPYASTRAMLLHHFERQARAGGRRSADQPLLTPSEQHVLRYLPSHLTNDEIAANLFLSVNTVKSHLRTLYRKLGVSNRRSAIAKGRQFGLLD